MKRKNIRFFHTDATNISGSVHIHNSTLVCGQRSGIQTDTDESGINAADLDQFHSLRSRTNERYNHCKNASYRNLSVVKL